MAKAKVYVSVAEAARLANMTRQRIHQLLDTPGAIRGAIAVSRGTGKRGQERKVWAIPVDSIPKRKHAKPLKLTTANNEICST